jgi:MFS family permease
VRRTALWILVSANAVSGLGNVVAVVALPWFVLRTTGSPALTGLTAFAGTAPLAVGALGGGRLAERVGVKRASVLADAGAATAIAGIPLLDVLGVLAFWHVLALAFLSGAAEGPGRAARKALLPDLAGRAGVPLERANAVSTTSEHLGYVVGAPAAGVLLALVGETGALWVDAASFAASALMVAAGVPAVRPARERGRLSDGLRFVARTPLVRTLFVIWTAGAFLVTPLAMVLLPVYASERMDGAGDLAAAVAALGVGGLAGTLAYGVAGRRIPRRPFFVGMWTLYPAVTFGYAALPDLPWLLALLAVTGFVTGAYDPFEVTLHQENVPPALRPRVFALLLTAEMSVVPVGMLGYGLVLDVAGLRPAMLLFATGNALLGSYALLSRPARRLAPPRGDGAGAPDAELSSASG